MSDDAKKNSAGSIIAIVLIFGLAYAVLRYHIVGPVPWKDFPFFILNKGLSLSAFILLTCNFGFGPLHNLGVRVPEGWLNARKALGMTAIVNAENRLLGIYTDGDLRRTLDHAVDVHNTVMKEVMTPKGKSIGPQMLAAEAVHIMETHKITSLIVVDEDEHIVGALNVHDLFRAGVM